MITDSEEVDVLPNEVVNKSPEMDNNCKQIERLLRERDISLKYNNELRDELKLLSAKLHLHQNVIKTMTSSVETQTDLSLINEDFSEKTIICCNCKKSVNSSDYENKSIVSNDWKQNSSTNKTRISDLVRETAEEVVLKNDFENDYLYDQKSKTYYSRSSGWYYYPESFLFYDPNTKNYYKYDSEKKVYNFYSTLKEMEQKRENASKSPKSKKLKKDIESSEIVTINESDVETIDTIDVLSSEEEGECDDSDDNSLISDKTDDFDNNDDTIEEKRKVSPPLVRMIVKKSSTLEIGSLLLVTCMGAKVGNDSNCDVWITDESVSRSHSEIRYDYNHKNYVIKDMKSTNGTFINGTKIESNSEVVLKHCDELCFGKCVLLVHIHYGKDPTLSCEHCEPGLVIASLKSNTEHNNSIPYEQTDKEKDRRKQLNCLKKKFGLKDMDYIEHKVSVITSNTSYTDRAEQRRVEKGSDNPYEKTGLGTSLDIALTKSNKGFKMMEKMGWASGQALGKNENGIIEPINVIDNTSKSQPSSQTES